MHSKEINTGNVHVSESKLVPDHELFTNPLLSFPGLGHKPKWIYMVELV